MCSSDLAVVEAVTVAREAAALDCAVLRVEKPVLLVARWAAG